MRGEHICHNQGGPEGESGPCRVGARTVFGKTTLGGKM